MRKLMIPVSFALAVLESAPAFAMSDKAFLDSAIRGDNSEMMLGNLAGHKAGSTAARSLGDTIEGDHSKARIQAVRLGDWRDVTAPTQPTPEAAAEADKLKSLSGERSSYNLPDRALRGELSARIRKGRKTLASGSTGQT